MTCRMMPSPHAGMSSVVIIPLLHLVVTMTIIVILEVEYHLESNNHLHHRLAILARSAPAARANLSLGIKDLFCLCNVLLVIPSGHFDTILLRLKKPV